MLPTHWPSSRSNTEPSPLPRRLRVRLPCPGRSRAIWSLLVVRKPLLDGGNVGAEFFSDLLGGPSLAVEFRGPLLAVAVGPRPAGIGTRLPVVAAGNVRYFKGPTADLTRPGQPPAEDSGGELQVGRPEQAARVGA